MTPIVLDQHPKTRSNDHSSEHHNEDAPDRSMRGIIAQSCAYSGLPKPLRVEPMVQSKLAGAAAALVDGRAWSEAGWRLPRRDNGLAHPFGSRPITHAVIEFAGPLSGPVLLGAGRFLGMGLCLPIP